MSMYQFVFELVPEDGSLWISKNIGKENIPAPGFAGRVKIMKELASGALLQLFGEDDGTPAESEDHEWGNEEKNYITLHFERGLLDIITCGIDLRNNEHQFIENIIKNFSQMNCAVLYDEKTYPLTEDSLNDLIISSDAYKFCNSPDEFFGTSGGTYLDKLKRIIETDIPVSAKESDMQSETAKLLLSLGVPRDDLEFFSMYGEGTFGTYFYFISPFGENWDEIIDEQRDIYNMLRADYIPEPDEESADCDLGYGEYSFYPENNGLLPWAYTDDCTVAWRINDGKVCGMVVYGDEITEYETLSVTKFMYGLICGKFEDIEIPQSLFDGCAHLEFISYGEETPDIPAYENDDDISPEERRGFIRMSAGSAGTPGNTADDIAGELERMGMPASVTAQFRMIHRDSDDD